MAAHENFVKYRSTKQSVATEKEKEKRLLSSAIEKGDITSVTQLIKTTPDLLNCTLDAYDNTALFLALAYENTDIIVLLVKNGALVNVPHKNGYTLLNLAIRYRNIQAIALFVDKGAQINVPDNYGNTPLHYAIQYRNMQAIESLLQNNADINISNKNGVTPSKLAARIPKIATLINNHKKTRLVSQFWEMEKPKYDSYSQWLPREVLEDVTALVMTLNKPKP